MSDSLRITEISTELLKTLDQPGCSTETVVEDDTLPKKLGQELPVEEKKKETSLIINNPAQVLDISR